MTTKWDARFMRLAEETASWSKDPNTKVGCVLVDNDRNVLSGGYNGFPRGVADDDRLQKRETKLEIVVHAEANAVAAAARNGHSLRGATVYVNRHPCAQCSALLIQAGVKRVVYQMNDEMQSRWAENFKAAKGILCEAGVYVDSLAHPQPPSGEQDVAQ